MQSCGQVMEDEEVSEQGWHLSLLTWDTAVTPVPLAAETPSYSFSAFSETTNNLSTLELACKTTPTQSYSSLLPPEANQGNINPSVPF